MNTQARALTHRLEQHIPGPSTPRQDSGFFEYPSPSIDELEIAEENERSSLSKATAVFPNHRYIATENDDLTRIGHFTSTSPKADVQKMQLTQQQSLRSLLTKPKDVVRTDRSRTPTNTRGVLKQILSQTYYGGTKISAVPQNRQKAKTTKVITENCRIQTEPATKTTDEHPQKAGGNLFTKKKKTTTSNLSINSPLAFEFAAEPGISSIGTVSHATPCNNENKEPNIEHKDRQAKREALAKPGSKTPNTEKTKLSVTAKKVLPHGENRNTRKTSPDVAKESTTNKKITREELAKKYEQEEMKECTFQPEVNPSDRSRRNLQQFLEDQSNFEAMKQYKILNLREEINRGIIESEKVVPPEIDERSRKLVEMKRREEGDDRRAHDRLYERSKSPKTTHNDFSHLGLSPYTKDAAEYTFHPRIRARSQNLKRDEPAAELLYKDALRRQSKSTVNLRLTAKSMGCGKSPFVNESSKRMLAHKLIKEFEAKTEEYFPPSQEHRFNYLSMTEFLRSLKFLRTATTEDVKNPYFVHERTLLYDMWGLLRGDQFGGVNERNLLAMLLAILGLNFPIPHYTPQNTLTERKNALDTSVDCGKSTPRYNATAVASRRESQSPDFSRSYYSQPTLSPNRVDTVTPKSPKLKYYPSTLSPQNVSLESSRINRSPFAEKTSQRTLGSYQILNGFGNQGRRVSKNDTSYDLKLNNSYQQTYSQKSARTHKSVMNFGSFDGENISFTDAEVHQISQVYEIFYFNRLHSTEKKIKDYQNCPFTPQILKSSRKLAENYREKQLSDTAQYLFDAQKSPPADGRLTHADLLIYQQAIQKQKLKERVQAYAKKELELCPFTPNILENKTHRSQRSVSPSNTEYQSSTPIGNVGIKRGQELYSLSKSATKKQDQSYVEWYDQKYGQECTFKPAILKPNKLFGAGDRSIDTIPDANKSIGRIKKGREEREFVNAMKTRGTSPQNGEYLSSFNCCLEKSAVKANPLDRSASKKESRSKAHTRDNSTNQTVVSEDTKPLKSTRQNLSKHLDSYEVESISKNTSFANGYKSSTLADYYATNMINSRRNTQQYKDLNITDLMNSRKPSIQSSHNRSTSRDEKRESNQSEQAIPLLFVDVNFGLGNTQRIVVYPGDRADCLAVKFAKEYNLDDTMKERLEMMLESQIGGVLAKIDEEMAAKADRQSFGSKSSQQ